jgi:hypothetical protein
MSQQQPIRQEAGADFRLHKFVPNAEAFGAGIDFLARVKPFSEFRVGVLTSAVRAQLRDGHHASAMRENAIIGHCGWVLTTREIGERWVREQVPLQSAPADRADAAALTLVRADEPKVLRRLIRVARELNPGRRVFFLREYADGLKRKRQTSVLNIPHAREGTRTGTGTNRPIG